ARLAARPGHHPVQDTGHEIEFWQVAGAPPAARERYMNQASFIVACGVAASALMLGLGLSAGGSRNAARVERAAVTETAGLDRGAVEKIVREYLISNPEVMLEVQEAYEERQQARQKAARGEMLTTYADEIYHSASDGVIGNPDGKITIVEFFDYNCGYCRGALADMQALVAANPDLRFVLKEFPILGPDSQKAHIVSMAFQSLYPEKYSEFHQALLGRNGRADEAGAIAIAVSLGADEDALRDAMEKPEISEAIGRNYSLATALSINATPAYIIGEEIVLGAIGEDALKKRLASLTN